jgi:hypothetical protein
MSQKRKKGDWDFSPEPAFQEQKKQSFISENGYIYLYKAIFAYIYLPLPAGYPSPRGEERPLLAFTRLQQPLAALIFATESQRHRACLSLITRHFFNVKEQLASTMAHRAPFYQGMGKLLVPEYLKNRRSLFRET